ncbi:MAG TPA: lytic transglycosylase domain-containing protein [Bryobacteraceae bacterium]|nr:lytic transglycosylase domain-containing protein [Bryobacteraceae bacterium]HPT27655.1 lytic transglycosylase domain-containing protein [Bryobacteraceae bacterium]
MTPPLPIRFLAVAAFAAASGSVLAAAEIAVLHTGFRMRADKVECAGETCVLHTGAGRIELGASAVARIEFEPDPPQPTEPAAASKPTPRINSARTPRELIDEIASRNGLPPEIVHSVAQAESAYQVNAVSPKGATGVMQLMPATARQYGADPLDPEQNIAAGTALLRDLLLKYENDPNPVRRALAAYNAGPGAVSKYNGVPPYRETQQYVERVLERYWKLVKAKPSSD